MERPSLDPWKTWDRGIGGSGGRMWQRPRVEETVEIRENKRPNSLVDLHRNLLLLGKSAR